MTRNLLLTFISTLTFFFSTSSIFAQSPTDLFISEYVEGSSNNKALEFYNGTSSAIDLSLGNYVVQMYFNGSLSASTNINLVGVVSPGSTFVLAQSLASFATSTFVNQTSSASWFNGDDAIVLRKGGVSGVIIDVIGQVGFDPGTEWGTGLNSTADNSLRRKSSSCLGDNNQTDVFDPAGNFDGFVQDDFSGLGNHTSTCSSSSGLTVSSSSLAFTATVGSVSLEQSYTVSANTVLTEDIVVTTPALSSFGLSLSAGGPYTNSLTIPIAQAILNPVTIFVVFSPSVAGLQSGNIAHSSGSVVTNLSVQGTAVSAGGTTKIYTIQGNASASSFDGTIVTTEGLVTADFQGTNQLGGFYIQDTTGDGNSSTSDGIFVFNTSFPVNVGDYIIVTGTVDEFFEKTELTNLTSVNIVSTGNNLVLPTDISLPASVIADLEKFEGMLIRFPQQLTVSETFTLGRFGELVVSAGGRLFNPSSIIDLNDNPAVGTSSSGTSNLANLLALQDLNNRSRIILDDASSIQNPPIVPYLNPIDSTLRIGTTISSLTGIMDYDFGNYRIQPSAPPVFNYASRPSVPGVGAANLKIASFNVLNYFNGDGVGGGFPTSRGANTPAEFTRQRTKIINAIKSLNADIVGLIEIENDGSGANSAIADLVNGLNTSMGAGTYSYILDPTGSNGNSGTDEIKCALIYKPSVVTPQGSARADINPVHNRPPLAQLFSLNVNSERFAVIVNHFKSKSCSGASGANADQGDGQGCYTFARKNQAIALLSFISSLQTQFGDSDIVSLGDYNAYGEEDPIDILRAGGLVQVAKDVYSYVFQGQTGALDYAFISSSLSTKVTGADKWHINSDEPIVKDYNQEFNPAYVYSPDAFRSSDHDPVLLGLSLGSVNNKPLITITSPQSGASYDPINNISLTAVASDSDGTIKRVEFYEGGSRFAVDSIAPYGFSGSNIPLGVYKVTARAFDNDGDSTISDTVVITVANCSGTGTLSAYGYTGIPGNLLLNLASHPSYPASPTVNTTVSKFEYGPSVGDEYGVKLRGYLCVPQTGNYVFYISSNDQSELWLSTDASALNIRRIAFVETATGFRQWFSNLNQRSIPIFLVQGVKYYVESIHKEGTGTDHLSVSWLLPNGAFEGPIPSTRLIPLGENNGLLGSGNRKEGGLEKALQIKDQQLQLIVSPNPSSSKFSLLIQSGKQLPIQIRVFNAAGLLVYQAQNVIANKNWELGSDFSSGVYFVEILQGNEKVRKKLIKQ